MEKLSVSDVANRVKAVMQVLSETDEHGVRVIGRDPDPSKRDGDLYVRLMHMASHPWKKYGHILDIVHLLYMERR